MALYTFYCFACSTPREVKFSFSEHEFMKDNLYCDCGGRMIQRVEPPKFKMNGHGWAWDNGYSTSQMEIDKNLDSEKKFEEKVYTDQGKERNIKEL
jgi:hypothetical protein